VEYPHKQTNLELIPLSAVQGVTMDQIKASRRLALVAMVVLPWHFAGAQSLLDGRKFNTEAGFTGKPAHIKVDILSFQAGKFHSSDCDQYGYNRGDYRTMAQGDGVAFEVETVSEQYGRNVWKGVVKGDVIEGTMVFYRKPSFWRSNPEPIEHWFKGKAIP
jgi:hypothetical protein